MAVATPGALRTFARPRITATAGTVFSSFVPPLGNLRTKLTYMKVTEGTTAHTYTFMTPLAKTTAAAAAAASATSFTITRDPGVYAANAVLDGQPVPSVADNPIATNDWVAVQNADGTWSFFKATVSTLTISGLTVSAAGILAGATFYFFGLTTDVNPITGEAHRSVVTTVSSVNVFDPDGCPLAETPRNREPILIQCDNATAASIMEVAAGVYGL